MLYIHILRCEIKALNQIKRISIRRLMKIAAMFRPSKARCSQICSLLGAHLILSSANFLWIYGNLSAYVTPYVYFYAGTDQSAYLEWILSVYVASITPGFFLAGVMFRRIGYKWTGIISMVIYNTAVIGCAWAVSVSGLVPVLLLGVCVGLASGVCMSTAYSLITAWSPEHAAFFLGTAACSPSALAIIQNQAITEYVNPDNLKADTIVGPKIFFSQTDLLERVPGALILVGVITLAVQSLGFLILSNPPDLHLYTQEFDHSSERLAEGGTLAEDTRVSEHAQKVSDTESQRIIHHAPIYTFYTNDDKANQTRQGIANDVQCIEHVDHTNNPRISTASVAKLDTISDPFMGNNNFMTKTKNIKHEPASLNPSKAVKTMSFWMVWLSNAALTASLLLENNYYKLFGLLYIDDDKLLTLLGILMSVSSPIAKILSGWLLDRGSLNIQDVCVISVAINTLVCALWYFSVRLGSAAYIVVILFLAAAQSTSYIFVPSAARDLFGPQHYTYNLALLMSPYLAVGLPLTFAIPAYLYTVGWYWLFTTCGFFSLIVLGFVAFHIQARGHKEF